MALSVIRDCRASLGGGRYLWVARLYRPAAPEGTRDPGRFGSKPCGSMEDDPLRWPQNGLGRSVLLFAPDSSWRIILADLSLQRQSLRSVDGFRRSSSIADRLVPRES